MLWLQVAGELLVCEHEPVFTFGLRQAAHYHQQAAALKSLGNGVEVHKVSPSLFSL